MSRTARNVVIDHVRHSFTIDGHEFPYWMALAGPEVQRRDPARAAGCVVQIPLIACNVRVITDDEVVEYPSPWPDVDDQTPTGAGGEEIRLDPADFKSLPLMVVPLDCGCG